jgi:hypothetical protein
MRRVHPIEPIRHAIVLVLQMTNTLLHVAHVIEDASEMASMFQVNALNSWP